MYGATDEEVFGCFNSIKVQLEPVAMSAASPFTCVSIP